ncbi:hypothetical protein RCO28_31865 [Streptomyces sp. LHD-70]|uniref:hypothetical protein n=1 Tax=Streptomyces sp. LHD-70 TaxID=3072140 RepID=UPI00280F80FE|nr:hypothetical protein [Streptomyces sp. LHD-70]MDQ8707037.1 hypothetical protein [Streptomyces sp. LHD-70]
MPFTLPSRAGSDRPIPLDPGRRALLVSAVGTVLLAGCSDGGSDASGKRSAATEQARARAAEDSAELLNRYDAVIAAHPALADRLRPLRTEVAEHAKAFGGSAESQSAAPSGPSSPAKKAPEVPADEKGALVQLADAERQLADGRRTALTGVPGEQARLFASVAAAGDAHAYLLSEAGR